MAGFDMSFEVDLEPCPFCGERAVIWANPWAGSVTIWCDGLKACIKPEIEFSSYDDELRKVRKGYDDSWSKDEQLEAARTIARLWNERIIN